MRIKHPLCRSSLCKILALGFALGAMSAVPSSEAITFGLSTATPAVGAGVQNLNFATSTANVAMVPGNLGQSNYIAGDNGVAIGQTFTTGSGTGVLSYSLTSISVRQVGAYNTFYDYTGGNIALQVFRLVANTNPGVYSITPLLEEPVAVGGAAGGFNQGTLGANAQWLTLTLNTALTLQPNTQYGFQIISDGTGANDGFFLETDGTNTNPYAGGFALGTAKVNGGFDGGFVYDGNNGQISDRAFVASMTAVVPEPSTFVLAGLGGMVLVVLRRRS